MDRYQRALAELDELRRTEHSFSEIEDYIEAFPGDRDERAALWMMAWSELERSERAQVLLD